MIGWCDKHKNYRGSGIILRIAILTIISYRWQCCNAEKLEPRSFSYAINSGGILSQHTEETEFGIVRGSFSFLQPDGQIRVVQYQVDNKTGFRVVVQYRRLLGNLMGHLRYTKDFSQPIILVAPVSLITSDLFESEYSPT